MWLRINTNISAMNAYRNLSAADQNLSKSLEKLSSGLRINKASDDAAGLSVSQGLKEQVSNLDNDLQSTNNASSLVNVAVDAGTQVSNVLERAQELAKQASDENLDDSTRENLNNEFQSLMQVVTYTTSNASFNGVNLVNGEASGSVATFNFSNGNMDVKVQNLTLSSLGLSAQDISTAKGATEAVNSIAQALNTTNSSLNTLKISGDRLQHMNANLGIAKENINAAQSRITDVDMAKEMTASTKQQILTQSSTAMLSQANASTSRILELLR